jgi:hypothetical protein
MGGFGGFFLRIRQQCSYQLQKIAYTYAVYAVEQISNDIAKYRFPLKKTATTANQNPIIQHTSFFVFS